MAASNHHINVKTATFQPGGAGAVTTLAGIKSADYDEGISVLKESADGDLFMSIAAAVGLDPKITLQMIRAFQLFATVGGSWGTLELDIPDAYNGMTAAGGGYTITMTHAILEQRSQQHGHRKFSTQTLAFGSYAPDGVTHPVTIAAA